MTIGDRSRFNFKMIGVYWLEGLQHRGFLITADSSTLETNTISILLGIPICWNLTEINSIGWVCQNIYSNIPALWNARAITSKARSTFTEKSRDQCLRCVIVKSGRDSGCVEWWRKTAGNLAFIYAATIAVSSSMASLGELDMVMSRTAFCFCWFVVESSDTFHK